MSPELYRLVGASIGLAASLGTLGLAATVLLRRPESASLFIEDKFGYFVVKAVTATLLGLLGACGFDRSLTYLLP